VKPSTIQHVEPHEHGLDQGTPPVPGLLGELEDQLHKLREMTVQTRDQLGPVLGPPRPTPGPVDVDDPDHMESPLATRIRDLLEIARSTQRVVNDIAERVEV